MNNSKLRKIILEELSKNSSEKIYRRSRKLGLVDYLSESTDHLMELDDDHVISTGSPIHEQGLGDSDFDVTTAGLPDPGLDDAPVDDPAQQSPSPEPEAVQLPKRKNHPRLNLNPTHPPLMTVLPTRPLPRPRRTISPLVMRASQRTATVRKAPT